MKFGGHKHAAGLSIDQSTLEAFMEKFDEVADGYLTESDLTPELGIDAELSPEDITPQLAAGAAAAPCRFRWSHWGRAPG